MEVEDWPKHGTQQEMKRWVLPHVGLLSVWVWYDTVIYCPLKKEVIRKWKSQVLSYFFDKIGTPWKPYYPMDRPIVSQWQQNQ